MNERKTFDRDWFLGVATIVGGFIGYRFNHGLMGIVFFGLVGYLFGWLNVIAFRAGQRARRRKR